MIIKKEPWEEDKPDSVLGDHSSRGLVTETLKRSNGQLDAEHIMRAASLASDRVYNKQQVAPRPLAPEASFSPCLKREFPLQRSVFCCTFRSLTAPSLSLVSPPAKSRLSSIRWAKLTQR